MHCTPQYGWAAFSLELDFALDVQTALLGKIKDQWRLSIRKEHMIDCFIYISEKSMGHLCILNVATRSTYRYMHNAAAIYLASLTE